MEYEDFYIASLSEEPTQKLGEASTPSPCAP